VSDLLTSAQLDELTRLLADVQLVTPWLYSRERREVDTAQRARDGDVYDGPPWSAAHYDNDPLAHAEGQFITAIVNAAPALIAAARELATLRAALLEACTLAGEYHGACASYYHAFQTRNRRPGPPTNSIGWRAAKGGDVQAILRLRALADKGQP